MAEDGDLIFQIDLDNQAAIRSLKEMEDAAVKAGNSGNQAMKKWGADIGVTVDQLMSIQRQVKAAGNEMVALTGRDIDIFGKAEINAKEFRAFISKMFGDIEKQAEDLSSREIVDFTRLVKAPSFAGKSTIAQAFEIVGIEEAEQKMEHLREVTERMLASTDAQARKIGGTLQGLGEHWLESMQKGGMSTDEANAKLGQLLSSANKAQSEFQRIFQQDAIEPLNIANAEKQFDILKAKAEDFARSATEEGQEFGKKTLNSLKIVEKAWDKNEISAGEYGKSVKKINSEMTAFGKTVTSLGKKDIDLAEQLNLQKAKTSSDQLQTSITTMLESTNVEAQKTGRIFVELRSQLIKAFRDGDKSAEEFAQELDRLQKDAMRTGKAYEENIGGGAKKSTASVWKLGYALDRVGIRGAGGMIRIADGIKGIHPAALAAVAGIAVIGLTIKAVVTAVIELEKKMIKFFMETIKQSVQVAKEFELIERQFTNIFKGNEAVAKRTMDRILDLSIDFGVDLTQQFSKVFLPLVDSFAQFEKLAEHASTLMTAFGEDSASTARAFGQGIAGRFRSMQDKFKLLGSDIDIIKRKQEELGEIEGFIAGMDMFFARSGQNWDTYEGTLQRVIGSLDVLKRKLLLVLGDPIKNEVVIQLQNIIDWVQENEKIVRAFLTSVGETVAGLAEKVGGAITGFLDDLSIDDFQAVEDALNDIAFAAQGLVDAITGGGANKMRENMNFILSAAITLLEILSGTLEIVTDIVETLQDLHVISAESSGSLTKKYVDNARAYAEKTGMDVKDALESLATEFSFDKHGFELGVNLDPEKWKSKEIRAMYKALQEIGLSGEAAIKVMEGWGLAVEKVKGPLEDTITGLYEKVEALEDSSEALDDEGDAILANNKAQADAIALKERYLELLPEVTEELKKLNEEMSQEFASIFMGNMLGDIDDEIAKVSERIIAEQQKIANLEALQWQVINVDMIDLDAVMGQAVSNMIGYQQEIDAILADIVSRPDQITEEEMKRLQMQIDFNRKRIKIEQDHIDAIQKLRLDRAQDEEDTETDRLRKEADILTKFNRKVIEEELDHSRKIEQMERAHRDRLREIRMRADFDAQEAIRRNDAVELLRIRRKMELDIKLANKKNDEQKRDANDNAEDKRDKLNRQLQYELDDLELTNARKLEDIETNFKRQVAVIEDNYQKQIQANFDAEKQKREDTLIWLKTQLDDFEQSWNDKNRIHKEKWQEFYDIESKYINMLNAQRQQIISSIPGGPNAMGAGLGVPGSGGGIGGRASTMGASPYGGYGAGSPSAGGFGSVSASVRAAGIRFAQDLFDRGMLPNLTTWTNQIDRAMTIDEFNDLMEQLIRIGQGLPPRQHGGLVSPGMPYMVGEKGPEKFMSTKAGIIAPAQREFMPVGAPQIQHITTDNSRSISAPISMLDPSSLSPVQITLIQSIVTEQLLRSAV